jgi:phosphoesterase RecJ-like protein
VRNGRARTRICQTLREKASFAIACHENPDGDAIGSVLGLSLGLMQMGKRVSPLCPHPVPRMYRFLPSWQIISSTPPDEPFEVGIAVDCDGSRRMAALEPVICGAQTVIDIDHHDSEHVFGDLVLVEPSAAATCEIILSLLQELGAPLTPEIATCLYCGLGTDTGFFRFQNTSARVLRVAAQLAEAGADPWLIAQKAYVSKPRSSLVLLGRALASLRCYADGAIAVGTLSLSDFAAAGALPEETEGIIDHMKTCEGVRVAVLLREQAAGGIRCSLRATDDTDVAAIAEEQGGGGHRSAAGCTLETTLQEAEARLVPRIIQALGESNNAPQR